MKRFILKLIAFSMACFLCNIIYGSILVFVLGVIPEKFNDSLWMIFQVHIAASVMITVYGAAYFLLLISVLAKLRQMKLSIKESFFIGIIAVSIKIILVWFIDNSIDVALLLIPSVMISYFVVCIRRIVPLNKRV